MPHNSHQLPVVGVAESDDAVVTFSPLGPDVNVLMVWPRFPRSYWGLEDSLPIVPVKGHTPPLALRRPH